MNSSCCNSIYINTTTRYIVVIIINIKKQIIAIIENIEVVNASKEYRKQNKIYDKI